MIGESDVANHITEKQQEPRIMAQFAQDENMINAYKEKKDLYATIASIVHNNGYWDNMEHYEDGTSNPDGKKRRSAIKSVVLGILYGSGPATVAEQITNGRRDKDGNIKEEEICTTKEAQEIIDKFYQGFPKVKKWIDETQRNASKLGYVEDMFGRRRRLPDLLLPRYVITTKEQSTKSKFNPLLGINESLVYEKPKIVLDYEKKFNECKSLRDVNTLKSQAQKDGLNVVDNGGFISRSERQCVNARIQGSAASMSKKAMINACHDLELKNLGFRLLIVVHDELIGECPTENAEACAKRLSEVMIQSALPEVQVPMKCDVEITKKWYESDYSDIVKKEYKSYQKEMTKEQAFEKIVEERQESTREELFEILRGE